MKNIIRGGVYPLFHQAGDSALSTNINPTNGYYNIDGIATSQFAGGTKKVILNSHLALNILSCFSWIRV